MATKKTVKKAAPAKKATSPAKKPAKPVAKAAAKKAVKPAAKPAKPAAKPAAKPQNKKAVAKPVAKKVEPVKKSKAAPAKPVKKEVEKRIVPAPKVKGKEEKKVVAKPAVPAPAPIPQKPAKLTKPEPLAEVKIPKTTVKTSVPYQPGYTPLEKRAESPKNNDPLIRYSDSDLNEFKELIGKKLEAAKKELAYLQGLITRKDDMGGDESDNRYMTMEDGSMSMEREQLSQMASRQITYIDHLEKALIRIENKTYGICRVTGKLIDKARLRAVPHATLSLEAKMGYVKPSEQ
ncbi:MAG TPA: TraR/DksA C4-type zinc finger protein [Panacibacter sp.]|nr:TraR/DksA C4-type zinc finger protein [Panacibacter sp.]HNP44224.1 TraR/DksA C4-type zinc finger protein [Panacibacter sp.]